MMSEWLIDEDPEALSATLSLVASWDNGNVKREPSSSPSTSSSSDDARDASPVVMISDAKSTGTRRGRVNATRERRKTEIEQLRSDSMQLQRQLFALRERREAMLRPHYSGDVIKTTAPVWETMARRQFQSRRRSEEYNAKLRAQIADQVVVAEGLMNAIQLAMQRQSLREEIRMPLTIDASQRMSEEGQLTRLHSNVDRWQWALSLSPKFHQRGELQFTDFVVVDSDDETATLDVYDSYVLPYALDSVSDLVWSAFHEETSGFDEDAGEDVGKYVQEHTTPNDLIVALFTAESTMGGASASRGTISGKWVAKQEYLRGRDGRLISLQWHYELAGFGNELDGASVAEDDWVRFVDAKDIGSPQLHGPVTVLQHVRRLRISFNRSEGVDASHVRTVATLLSKEIEGELAYARRSIENTLITQAVRPRLQSPVPVHSQ